MVNILEQQTEVQGTKEFGNIEGVEALSAKELKETDGGAWPVVAAIIVACAIFGAGAYAGYQSAQDAAK